MPDQITEVVTESWFSRIKNSFGAVVVGLVFTALPFFGLAWNEKNAIDVIRALKEAAREAISVAADPVSPQNEGKLVHFSGRADSADRVEDSLFGLSEAGLRLRRTVEMFQWKESKRQESKTKLGGGTETQIIYSYHTTWDDDLIDSTGFKDSATHKNPAQKLFASFSDTAKPVLVGGFTLPDRLVERISEWKPLPVPSVEKLPADVRSRNPQIAGDVLYFGKDPDRPVVGDTRVHFEVVRPEDVTVMAQQVGKTLEPHLAKSGKDVMLLKVGTFSSGQMIAMARSENEVFTWILRGVCLLVMFLGLSLLLYPVRVLADVVPIAGRLVGAGLGFVAFLLAAAFSSLTVAVSWVAVRPEVGIPLLVGVGGLVAWLVLRMKRANTPPPLPGQA